MQRMKVIVLFAIGAGLLVSLSVMPILGVRYTYYDQKCVLTLLITDTNASGNSMTAVLFNKKAPHRRLVLRLDEGTLYLSVTGGVRRSAMDIGFLGKRTGYLTLISFGEYTSWPSEFLGMHFMFTHDMELEVGGVYVLPFLQLSGFSTNVGGVFVEGCYELVGSPQKSVIDDSDSDRGCSIAEVLMAYLEHRRHMWLDCRSSIGE